MDYESKRSLEISAIFSAQIGTERIFLLVSTQTVMIIYTKRRLEASRDLCIFTRQSSLENFYPGFQVHKPSTSSHAIMFGNCSRSASILSAFFCSLLDCDMWDPMWPDIFAFCRIAHIKAVGAGPVRSVHWPRLASCERASSLLQRKCYWMSCHSVLCTLAGYLSRQCPLKTFN